jgi:hypothetical protein
MLCGVWHGFMPVVVEAVSSPDFLVWIDSLTQNSNPLILPYIAFNLNKSVSKGQLTKYSLNAMHTNIEINPIIKRLRFIIQSYINNKTNLDKYLSTNLNRILNYQKEIEQNYINEIRVITACPFLCKRN